MRLLASTLLLGAASAGLPPLQRVLQSPLETVEKASAEKPWEKPLYEFKNAVDGFSADAMAAWDEVAELFPEAMQRASAPFKPKPNRRRPNSEWDHVVKGANIQSLWVLNEDDEPERTVGGRLEQYNLRAKHVDPSVLGIDNVTQYSGYLDDEENDKHLFYCKHLYI